MNKIYEIYRSYQLKRISLIKRKLINLCLYIIGFEKFIEYDYGGVDVVSCKISDVDIFTLNDGFIINNYIYYTHKFIRNFKFKLKLKLKGSVFMSSLFTNDYSLVKTNNRINYFNLLYVNHIDDLIHVDNDLKLYGKIDIMGVNVLPFKIPINFLLNHTPSKYLIINVENIQILDFDDSMGSNIPNFIDSLDIENLIKDYITLESSNFYKERKIYSGVESLYRNQILNRLLMSYNSDTLEMEKFKEIIDIKNKNNIMKSIYETNEVI